MTREADIFPRLTLHREFSREGSVTSLWQRFSVVLLQPGLELDPVSSCVSETGGMHCRGQVTRLGTACMWPDIRLGPAWEGSLAKAVMALGESLIRLGVDWNVPRTRPGMACRWLVDMLGIVWVWTLVMLDTVGGGPLSRFGTACWPPAVRLLTLWICGSRALASLADDNSISTELEKPMMLTEVECYKSRDKSKNRLLAGDGGRKRGDPPIRTFILIFPSGFWVYLLLGIQATYEVFFQFLTPRRLCHNMPEWKTQAEDTDVCAYVHVYMCTCLCLLEKGRESLPLDLRCTHTISHISCLLSHP